MINKCSSTYGIKHNKRICNYPYTESKDGDKIKGHNQPITPLQIWVHGFVQSHENFVVQE